MGNDSLARFCELTKRGKNVHQRSMQRLFYSCGCDFHMKVGVSVVSCRRGGNSATFAIMNQFFGINGMPTVPSTYWNDVHGYKGEGVLADVEGCETIRNMATNMAFLIKAIRAAKQQKPDVKHTQFMNFFDKCFAHTIPGSGDGQGFSLAY